MAAQQSQTLDTAGAIALLNQALEKLDWHKLGQGDDFANNYTQLQEARVSIYQALGGLKRIDHASRDQGAVSDPLAAGKVL